jgi:hypothetical protein
MISLSKYCVTNEPYKYPGRECCIHTYIFLCPYGELDVSIEVVHEVIMFIWVMGPDKEEAVNVPGRARGL